LTDSCPTWRFPWLPSKMVFCEIDDFCKSFYPHFERYLPPADGTLRQRAMTMSASEVMTIVVLFHLNHYLDCVRRQMTDSFPKLLSYGRFVEVQGRVFPAHCAFMKAKTGHVSGLYYVDSTTTKVCRNQTQACLSKMKSRIRQSSLVNASLKKKLSLLMACSTLPHQSDLPPG
jgi:hypothetical protein